MRVSSKPEGIPEFIHYRGWTIWAWTGWKGTKAKVSKNWTIGGECFQCGKPFVAGESLYVTQGRPPSHWICTYPDNPLDTLQAQWLARKNVERFIMANCAVMPIADIPASEYRRGECFDIVPEEFAVNENTSEPDREKAKQAGFERIKLLIDQLEEEPL